ncbi:MAG: hypothetical protein KDD53_05770, partial [Bdellovibrionales bacterium]|nr:hypothetical protein [Bdellovibrionales bacterium]
MLKINNSSVKIFLYILFTAVAFVGCGGGGSDSDDNSEEMTPISSVVKIMPFGDSITEAPAGEASYRYWLWQDFLSLGLNVDFVGTRRGIHQGLPRFSDFDQDHQGYWSFRTDEVIEVFEDAIATTPVDIVLIHLGTNDMRENRSVDQAINNISYIISRFRDF